MSELLSQSVRAINADQTHPRGQWFFGISMGLLPAILIAFHLIDRLPASRYIDAMAKGQYSRAGELLQSEVTNNNPEARNSLGNLHYLGMGVDRNYRNAALQYHAAAKQGFAAAQLNLAHLYNQGLGVRKDAERAFGWYTHAKIAGNPWAENYLSQLSSELTLTPLQMAAAKTKWHRLDQLSAEPL
ncbi:tetratricopeptide repeat protein [Granulosicoccus antarcticus]|uniref:Localization factor PodJL n=1 Tax=Granulosicoccus antarcticus IMCC3135 TaxID=1192854 RepID=A0A2Z2NIB3_9GAMM|nr:SEL1-like repeat protein [Granulosicoccus antarcticus]ASJ70215.1 Localization factor PodJL [Granulosicoccus antarcticus IMCC3135]